MTCNFKIINVKFLYGELQNKPPVHAKPTVKLKAYNIDTHNPV